MVSLFDRALFSGATGGLVKSLSGFLKHHRVPDAVNPATRAFVARVGEREIDERCTELFKRLRDAFGFKRRELSTSQDAGRADIQCPAFVVQLHLDQDDAEPKRYALRCEVTGIRHPGALRSEAFASVFDHCFRTLFFASDDIIDVEEVIDRVEDADAAGETWTLDYPPSADSCTVDIEGFPATLCFEPHGVTLVRPALGPVADLLSAADKLPRILGADPAVPLLPG